MSRTFALAFVAASSLVACSLGGTGGHAAVGRVHAAISTVPPFTFCVEVVASAGRSVSKLVDVTPGQTSSVDLDDVPIGNVDFAAFAYGQACAGVTAQSQPSYASAPTPALVQIGQVTSLELTLLPVGGAHVGINFGDSDGGIVDGGGAPDLAPPADLAQPPADLAQPAHFSVQPSSFTWSNNVTPFVFVVVNDGPSTIGPFSISNPSPTFAITTTCGAQVFPGNQCTIRVVPPMPSSGSSISEGVTVAVPNYSATIHLTAISN